MAIAFGAPLGNFASAIQPCNEENDSEASQTAANARSPVPINNNMNAIAEKNTTTPAYKFPLSLYLIEFYTVEGEIHFAWVKADDGRTACLKLRAHRSSDKPERRVDDIIQCGEQAEIVPLAGDFKCNTPDANLFIIN